MGEGTASPAVETILIVQPAATAAPAPDPTARPPSPASGPVLPAAYRSQVLERPAGAGSPVNADCHPPLFSDLKELSADAVVQGVLARNPSLAQMVAAWETAQARYPQVTSLEDPMFAGTIGPETLSPDDRGVEFAYRLELSQTYPWPGKLALRGASAQAEASAAGHSVEDVRLQLVEAGKAAFYDYYLVARALDVNAENLKLLRAFRENAEKRYSTGLVPQQDIFQADVEIGRQQERQLTLERMRQVAVARINTLMHLPPDSPLPPPPTKLAVTDALPEPADLRARAVENRPDLQAVAERIKAEEASVALAQREFYPDFTPFVMYDRFMGNTSDNRDLATMLGVRLNVPVRLARRRAAVEEAKGRLAQRQAELSRQTDQVNFEVQQTYSQVLESERTVRLYEKTILPAAQQNIEAAQSAYATGKIPFLSLIEAQRSAVGLRDRYYEAIADYYRRRATLERVVGGSLVPAPAPGH
jgi:outer membrane protein TolC